MNQKHLSYKSSSLKCSLTFVLDKMLPRLRMRELFARSSNNSKPVVIGSAHDIITSASNPALALLCKAEVLQGLAVSEILDDGGRDLTCRGCFVRSLATFSRSASISSLAC